MGVAVAVELRISSKCYCNQIFIHDYRTVLAYNALIESFSAIRQLLEEVELGLDWVVVVVLGQVVLVLAVWGEMQDRLDNVPQLVRSMAVAEVVIHLAGVVDPAELLIWLILYCLVFLILNFFVCDSASSYC